MQALKREGWEMVIVYDVTANKPESRHSIFVKEYKDGVYHCINSHPEDPKPTISRERVIRLYYVAVCTAPDIQGGDSPAFPGPSRGQDPVSSRGATVTDSGE